MTLLLSAITAPSTIAFIGSTPRMTPFGAPSPYIGSRSFGMQHVSGVNKKAGESE
jgi:hypothetical protein